MDGYWEQDLKPWDVMAGMLLVREAGGTVTDYQAGDQPQRRDRGQFVASNGRLHAEMLEVLQSALRRERTLTEGRLVDARPNALRSTRIHLPETSPKVRWLNEFAFDNSEKARL